MCAFEQSEKGRDFNMKQMNKKYGKNQKGITMIALIITIIVLIILSGITINMGKEGIKESKENVFLTELGMIQNAVLQRKTKADLTGETYPGQIITEVGIDLDSIISDMNANKATGEDTVARRDSNDANYYLLSNENNGLEDIGIKESEDEYIVNYETGEVLNYTTLVTGSGKPLYIYAK